MSKKFLISSLLAAGFGNTDPLQAAITTAASTGRDDPDLAKLFQLYKQDHIYTLAQHRSHSSHSSHRSGSSGGHYSHYSHTSHRSSNGGYSTPSYDPAPIYTPPSPSPAPRGSTNSGRSSGTSQPLLSSPVTTEGGETKLGTTKNGETRLVSLSGRSALFKTIVMHVQVALMGQGLFDGPIDGVVGPKTRAALRTFQGSHGLTVTGTITPQTLDALHVPTE